MNFSRFILSASILAVAASSAHAATATYQWDTNGTNTGLGGAGTWDTTTANWDLVGTGADAGVDATQAVTFVNGDIAIFGGTAGTVTVNTTVAARNIQFAANGYQLDTNNSFTGGTQLNFNIGGSFTQRTVTITGTNASFTGGVQLQGVQLTADSLNTLGSSGTIQIGAVNGARNGSLIFTELGSVVSTNRIAFGFNANDQGSLPGANTIKNNSATANTLTLTNNIATNGGTNTISIIGLGGSNTGNNTISGNISNGAQTKSGISKVDAGTWVLTGTNTYGGTYTRVGTPAFTANIGTTVAAGKLITGNASALGVGNVTVSGGALQIGNGTVNTLTLGNNATVSIGDAAKLALGGLFLGALDNSGSVISLAGTGTFTFNLSGGLDLGGFLDSSSTGLFSGTHTYNLFSGGAGAGNTDVLLGNITGYDSSITLNSFNNGVLTFTAVPEPGAIVSLVGGLGMLMGLRRRRS